MVSWSIPQQPVIHPGDRFTACEFDQAAVKVGFWTNWTACWVNCSTSKRSLHITLTHYILCSTQPLCSEPRPYLHLFKTKWKIKLPATKLKCFSLLKYIKIAGLFLFWNLLPIILHLKVLISLYFFYFCFLSLLILPAEHWTVWAWIKTIPRQPRSLSWCHVLLITSH